MSRLTGMLCLFLACGTAPSATRVALVTASSQDRRITSWHSPKSAIHTASGF